MLFFIVVKNVLKHTISYVHSIDLLIWSTIQLKFPFYNLFAMIFFKNVLEGNLTGFGKFRGI
jgi:hypothetical protein